MSFVDLFSNDIWSDADITRRTESMIRSEFSLDAETILNRKVIGISLGTYTPTEQDQADMARYNAVAVAAQIEGVAARNDMALLLQVFFLEEAQRRLDISSLSDCIDRLALPEVKPVINEETSEVENAKEVEKDKAEREAAENILSPHLIENSDGELVVDPAAIEKDEYERLEAQEVIDSASEDVKDLFMSRKDK